MLDSLKIVTATDYSSGTDDVNGAAVFVGEYDGVIAVVHAAAIEALGENTVLLQCSDTAAFSAPYTIDGATITVAADDDNQIFALEVIKPPKPYVRLVVDKDATHALAEASFYILFGPGYKPQDNDIADKTTTVTVYQPGCTVVA